MLVAFTVDYGTVPAWLTLGTVSVGLVTFVMARLDASRAAAAQVYAVVVSHRFANDERGGPHTDVVVHNDGIHPIFEPSVQLWDWGKPRRLTWRFRRIENWLTHRRVHYANGTYVPPQTKTARCTLVGLSGARTGMGSGIPPIVLMFRDGNGRLWARWPDGQLKRVSPSRWLAKKAPPRKPDDPEPPPIVTLELPDTIEPTPPG